MSDWKTRATPVAEGGDWKSRATAVSDSEPAAAPKQDPLAEYPGTAFALGSLNKLAMGGGSAALALKDMLKVTDSRSGQNDKSGRSAQQLYLDNKKFYDEGFDRLGKANPKAEALSNAAYLVGPSKGGNVLARGAVRGAAEGLVGGPHSLADDPDGVLGDVERGAGFGAAGAAAGAALGKVTEFGGNLARRQLGRVMGKVNADAIGEHASQVGKAGKQAQEAVGGLENLHLADEMKWGANFGGQAFKGVPQPQVQELLRRRVGNAKEKIADLFDNPRQVESMGTLLGRAKQAAVDRSKGAVKDLAVAGALGYGGEQVANAVGLPKGVGYAVGGAAPLYFLRNATRKALANPKTLEKLIKLKPVGEFLARHGGKFGSAEAAATGLAVFAKQHPEVEQAILSVDRASQGSSPEAVSED